MTITPTDISRIAAAATFVPPKHFGGDAWEVVRYAESGSDRQYIRTQDVARYTLDQRFALVRVNGKTSYQLAVRVEDEAEVERLTAYSREQGYGTNSAAPLYRSLPFYRRSSAKNRYGRGTTLADIIAEAAEITVQLATLEDVYTLELDVALEPVFTQLVALTVKGAGENGRVENAGGWHSALSQSEREMHNVLERKLQEAGEAVHVFGKTWVKNAVYMAARAELKDESRYSEMGTKLVFTGERLNTATRINAAHDEAISYVLETRQNRDQGVATLRARRVELEAELVTVLANEVDLAEQRHRKLCELSALAQHSPEDAAQRILDNGSSIVLHGSGNRSSYRVAEEMADVDRQLEQAASWAVPNTLLDTPSEVLVDA